MSSEIDWPRVVIDERDWMLGVLRSRIESIHVAEEIVQEVCVVVLEHPNPPTDSAAIRAWLFQILTRRAADHYRSLAVERRAIDGQRVDVEADEDGRKDQAAERSPWKVLAQYEQRDDLRQGLKQLPEDDRRLLIAKFVDQLSYRQLADRLNCSERTVEYRLVQAKSRLKTALASLRSLEDWTDA